MAAGILATAIQRFALLPLIRQAEAFEAAGHAHAPSLLATAAANVVLAVGFALLLATAMSLRNHSGWRKGLGWGVAGFLAVFALPALGLPPELPGSEAAHLHDRQLWWAMTVALSAGGLWLLAFAAHPALRVAGLVLLVLPHLAGAPQPAVPGGTAPVQLTAEFVRAAWLSNAAMWMVLGLASGMLLRHPPLD